MKGVKAKYTFLKYNEFTSKKGKQLAFVKVLDNDFDTHEVIYFGEVGKLAKLQEKKDYVFLVKRNLSSSDVILDVVLDGEQQ
jgi:hypothetical protein